VERKSPFTNFKYIGYVPTLVVPLQKERATRYRFEDELFRLVPVNVKTNLSTLAGEYYRAVPDYPSYMKSVLKMDVVAKVGFRDSPRWLIALAYIEKKWDPVFARSTRLLEPEEIYSSIVYNTASGIPLSCVGLKKEERCHKL